MDNGARCRVSGERPQQSGQDAQRSFFREITGIGFFLAALAGATVMAIPRHREQAILATRSGHDDLANKHLTEAWQTSPGDVELAYVARDIFQRAGKIQLALPYMQAALVHNPTDYQLRMATADSQVLARELTAALATLQGADLRDEDTERLYHLMIGVGDLASADALLRKHVAADPDDLFAWNELVLVERWQNHFPEALRTYETIIRRFGHEAAQREGLGLALWHNDLEMAERMLVAYEEYRADVLGKQGHPDHDGHLELGAVSPPMPMAFHIDSLREAYQRALSFNNKPLARKSLDFRVRHPQHALEEAIDETRFERWNGHYNTAWQASALGLERYPYDRDLLTEQLLIALAMDQDDSVSLSADVLAGASPELAFMVSGILLNAERPKQALDILRQHADSDNLSVQRDMVYLALQHGQQDLALQIMDRIERSDTISDEQWQLLASAYGILQRFADQRRVARQWVAEAPKNVQARAVLLEAGLILSDYGRLQQDIYQAELALPEESLLWNAYAAQCALNIYYGSREEGREYTREQAITIIQTYCDRLAQSGGIHAIPDELADLQQWQLSLARLYLDGGDPRGVDVLLAQTDIPSSWWPEAAWVVYESGARQRSEDLLRQYATPESLENTDLLLAAQLAIVLRQKDLAHAYLQRIDADLGAELLLAHADVAELEADSQRRDAALLELGRRFGVEGWLAAADRHRWAGRIDDEYELLVLAYTQFQLKMSEDGRAEKSDQLQELSDLDEALLARLFIAAVDTQRLEAAHEPLQYFETVYGDDAPEQMQLAGASAQENPRYWITRWLRAERPQWALALGEELYNQVVASQALREDPELLLFVGEARLACDDTPEPFRYGSSELKSLVSKAGKMLRRVYSGANYIHPP